MKTNLIVSNFCRHSNDGVSQGKYTRTSQSFTDNSEVGGTNNINTISTRNFRMATSARRPVAKHNSMLYTPGTRKPKWVSVKERRRRSVPTMTGRKNSLVESRWSSRRESVDTQYKGIRWKPFTVPRNEEPLETLSVHTLENRNSLSDFTYVNPAYASSPRKRRVASTPLEHPREDVVLNQAEERTVQPNANQDCEKKSRTSTPVSISRDVVLNLPLHDSLV